MNIEEILERVAGQEEGAIVLVIKTETGDLQEQNRVANVLRKAASDNGAQVILATAINVTKKP